MDLENRGHRTVWTYARRKVVDLSGSYFHLLDTIWAWDLRLRSFGNFPISQDRFTSVSPTPRSLEINVMERNQVQSTFDRPQGPLLKSPLTIHSLFHLSDTFLHRPREDGSFVQHGKGVNDTFSSFCIGTGTRGTKRTRNFRPRDFVHPVNQGTLGLLCLVMRRMNP